MDIKNKKHTIIFDFDETIYSAKKFHSSYFGNIISSSVDRNSIPKEKAFKIVQNEIDKFPVGAEGTHEGIKAAYDILKFDILQKDIDFSIQKTKEQITQGLEDVIVNLLKNNHEILVIGGGIFGCAVIPHVVKDLGILPKNIYSGYIQKGSDDILGPLLKIEYKYVNAETLDLNIPKFIKKSDLIKYLIKTGEIKGPIIHIGDHINDLEVQDGNIKDLTFIGFGLNNLVLEVEKNAKIFVKTIEEFKNEIYKITAI